MSEEEETKEKEPETSTASPGDGVPDKVPKATQDARDAAKDLKAENDRKEKLLNEEKEILARRELGGVAEAGQPSKKKEETPSEYAKKVMEAEE